MTRKRLPAQEEILRAIMYWFVSEGGAPTVAELCVATNRSASVVQQALDKLEIAGRIRRVPGRHRNIRLCEVRKWTR